MTLDRHIAALTFPSEDVSCLPRTVRIAWSGAEGLESHVRLVATSTIDRWKRDILPTLIADGPCLVEALDTGDGNLVEISKSISNEMNAAFPRFQDTLTVMRKRNQMIGPLDDEEIEATLVEMLGLDGSLKHEIILAQMGLAISVAIPRLWIVPAMSVLEATFKSVVVKTLTRPTKLTASNNVSDTLVNSWNQFLETLSP